MSDRYWQIPVACFAVFSAVAILVGKGMDRPQPLPGTPYATLEGVCIHVVTGDSFDMTNGREVVRVKFADVEAPEIDQPFGVAAKMFLAKRIEKHAVWVAYARKDDGAYQGLVWLEEPKLDVNREMVEAGLGWAKERELLVVQEAAKAKRAGLWSDEDAIEPSQWRKGERPKQRELNDD